MKYIGPIVIGFLFIVAICAVAAQRVYKEEVAAFYKRHEARLQAMNNHSTMLFITGQIIVALATVQKFAGGAAYPSPFSDVVALMDFISLNMFELLHVDCMVRDADFGHTLVGLTLLPLAIGALAFFCRAAWVTVFGGDFMRGPSMKVGRLLWARVSGEWGGGGGGPMRRRVSASADR